MDNYTIHVDFDYPEEEAAHYWVVLDKDHPGVYVERPRDLANGRWPKLLPIIIVCDSKNDTRKLLDVNEEVMPFLTDPNNRSHLLGLFVGSDTMASLFTKPRHNFYSLRVSGGNGIYANCDWNEFVKDLCPLKASKFEIKGFPTFLEALDFFTDRSHLAPRLPVSSRPSSPVKPSHPASPVKPSRSASPVKPTSMRTHPSDHNASSSSPSSPVRRSHFASTWPTVTVPTMASRPPSPQKTTNTVKLQRATTLPVGAPTPPPSSRYLVYGAPTPHATTSILNHGISSSSSSSSIEVNADLSRALNVVKLEDKADQFYDAREIIVLSPDPIRRVIRRPLEATDDVASDLPIIDLGHDVDIWIRANNYTAGEQLALLRSYIWAKDAYQFTVLASQAPLNMDLKDALVLWNLIPTWLAPK